MKASFLKILSLISGVLLVFSGIVSIFNWFGAITSVSMILGLAMLIAGAFSMLLAFAVRGDIFGAPWLMRDGVLSVVTALLLFSAAAITSGRVTVILAMWSVCCGIGRLFGSFEQKKKKGFRMVDLSFGKPHQRYSGRGIFLYSRTVRFCRESVYRTVSCGSGAGLRIFVV